MARKYYGSRFVMVTVAQVRTVDEDFNVVDVNMIINGFVTKEEAQKQATKRFAKAKVLDSKKSGIMYAFTREELMTLNHQVNPYTRQPWADDEDRDAIIKKYIDEKYPDGLKDEEEA